MKNNLVCYATRFGPFVHDVNDRVIGRSLRLYGEWAPGETALLSGIVQHGDVVIDVGANIGYHSLFFSRLVGEDGTVISFEPDRTTHQLLQFNSVINDLNNVTIFNSLVGRDSRIVTSWRVEAEKDNRGSTSFVTNVDNDSEDRCDPLMQVSLDSLNLDRCDFIKIDVEGFEPEVFAGATETLTRCRPVILYEQRSEENYHEIQKILRSADYRSYWSVTHCYPEFNIHDNKDDFFKGATEINILAIPHENVADYSLVEKLAPVADGAFDPPALSQLDDDHFVRQNVLTPDELKWIERLSQFLKRKSPAEDSAVSAVQV